MTKMTRQPADPARGYDACEVGPVTVKQKKGFAVMDATRQREIASQGGKMAHLKGTAHEFNSEQAREAGKLSHKNRLPGTPRQKVVKA